MVVRALRLHCPRCGSGRLFTRWVRMADRCPGCGFRFDRGDDAFFLGAYFVNLLVTEAVLFGLFIWLIMRESADPHSSIAVLVGIGVAVAVLVPIVFYPVSRTLWAAVQLASDPLELREIVDAVDAVDASAPPRGGGDGGAGPDGPGGPVVGPGTAPGGSR